MARMRPTFNKLRNACLASLVVAPVVLAANANAAASYDAAADGYSMAAITAQSGATMWWGAGFTGRGVDVALIDTGVAPVNGLTTPGKLIYGPDLSLESQAPNLANFDTNGHGTFMAGLIAGHDNALATPYASAPASQYRGIAPDARIVSLKVATADGGVDVTQVIAAINWVVDHKTDNGMNIRVLNLSYGTDTTQPSVIDPLSFAVERAWKAGIIVVAAAGNSGYVRSKRSPTLADPAYNPFVIAVGGYDTMGTASPADDTMGAYSQGGCSSPCKKPDFSAVGSHLQGLRVPNGFVDSTHPEGRLGDRYFRGSGTSEAAAITSGSIALLLQRFPTATPDRIKKFMAATGGKLTGPLGQQGAGAVNMNTLIRDDSLPMHTQHFASALGTGSVELSRGRDHISQNGVQLVGDIDIFGKPFTSTSGGSWSGGTWNGSTWSGSTWSGSTWSGSTWSGSTWSSSTWSGSTWSGSTWSGSTWSGSTWSGSSWSGNGWSSNNWATGSWS
jgi:serine protease AprX